MDYKKKYNKLVEAIKVLQELNPSDEGIQNWVNDNVPELQESKDATIRRIIRGWIYTRPTSFFDNGISKEEILAWLEKQGQVKEYTFKMIPRLLEMIEPTERAKAYCQKLIDALTKEGYITDAKIVEECLKQMNGEKVALATMDEQKINKSEDERIRKAIIEFFELQDDNTTYSLVPKKDILDWLEKQADKDKLIKELGKYKEFGYEWNENKKELRKINDRLDPLVDEEIDLWIKENSNIHHNDINIVGLMRDMAYYVATLTRNLYRQKSKWTEEDEDYLNDLERYFVNLEPLKHNAVETAIWLKSLKQRMEEQQ